MESGPFMGDFPIKTSIQFGDFAASHVWWNQRVNTLHLESCTLVKSNQPEGVVKKEDPQRWKSWVWPQQGSRSPCKWVFIDVYWCLLMFLDVYWCLLVYRSFLSVPTHWDVFPGIFHSVSGKQFEVADLHQTYCCLEWPDSMGQCCRLHRSDLDWRSVKIRKSQQSCDVSCLLSLW